MKYKLNLGQTSCLLIAILIVIFFVYILGLKLFQYIQPRWFPKQEDLIITEWSTYTEYFTDRPLFKIKYPRGWLVKTTGSGGSGPHTEIRSPWNYKNNKDGNFILIDIFWHAGSDWGGADPLLGSPERTLKFIDNDQNFIDTKIDNHRALFAKKGIDGSYKNYIYIFTDTPLFKEDAPSSKNNTIFRIKLSFNTKQDPKKIEKIYGQIVNSFNYLE